MCHPDPGRPTPDNLDTSIGEMSPESKPESQPLSSRHFPRLELATFFVTRHPLLWKRPLGLLIDAPPNCAQGILCPECFSVKNQIDPIRDSKLNRVNLWKGDFPLLSCSTSYLKITLQF